MQRRAVLERAGERARQRHLEPVENPGDAERHHDQRVKAAPRQPVEPRRNVGFDDLACRHALPFALYRQRQAAPVTFQPARLARVLAGDSVRPPRTDHGHRHPPPPALSRRHRLRHIRGLADAHRPHAVRGRARRCAARRMPAARQQFISAVAWWAVAAAGLAGGWATGAYLIAAARERESCSAWRSDSLSRWCSSPPPSAAS